MVVEEQPDKAMKMARKSATSKGDRGFTIKYSKLSDELRYIETVFRNADIIFPNRTQLNFPALWDCLSGYSLFKDLGYLDEAEQIIRSYLQDQDEITAKEQKFIGDEAEGAFTTFMAQASKEARRLNGLSPSLWVESFNDKFPKNTLDGNMKQAYMRLAFVHEAVTLLMAEKIALVAGPKAVVR